MSELTRRNFAIAGAAAAAMAPDAVRTQDAPAWLLEKTEFP